VSLYRRFRDGIGREIRLELSLVFFMLALFMLVEATTQVFWINPPDVLRQLHLLVNDYVVWFWFLGGLLLLIAGWYVFDSVRKRREFRHLIDTTSKQKMLRNRERLELLAFILPRAYEIRLQKKLAELEVK